MQFPNDTPPNPTSPPYPIKNERSHRFDKVSPIEIYSKIKNYVTKSALHEKKIQLVTKRWRKSTAGDSCSWYLTTKGKAVLENVGGNVHGIRQRIFS